MEQLDFSRINYESHIEEKLKALAMHLFAAQILREEIIKGLTDDMFAPGKNVEEFKSKLQQTCNCVVDDFLLQFVREPDNANN